MSTSGQAITGDGADGRVHLVGSIPLAGAERVVGAAATAVGVVTECGFGRRPPDTIAPLLALHATVADLAPRSTRDV